MPSCGSGLGLGYGGAGIDTDALAYFNRAGIASGTLSVPQYSSKNKISQSNNFSLWAIIGTSITPGISDPFSGMGAYLVVPSAALATHTLNISLLGITTGTPYTYSVYAKAAGYNFVTIRTDSGVSISVNLTNGTVAGSETAPTSSSVTSVGNGWYRISFVYSPSSTTPGLNITSTPTGGSGYQLSFTGDGTSGAYIYGAQYELGSTATTLVTTSGNVAFGNSGSITINPRQNIIDFVKGIKTLGLWNNFVCWPLISVHNAGTGNTAYSLGGAGIFDGTLKNGPTWGTAGITSACNGDYASTAQHVSMPSITVPRASLGLVTVYNSTATSAQQVYPLQWRGSSPASQTGIGGYYDNNISIDNARYLTGGTQSSISATPVRFDGINFLSAAWDGVNLKSKINSASVVSQAATATFVNDTLGASIIGGINTFGTSGTSITSCFAAIITAPGYGTNIQLLYDIYKATIGSSLGLP